MKKMFASDNVLKVISIFIAIVIWIYIAIVMDPAIEITVRDLPIQFIGQEGLLYLQQGSILFLLR